MSINKMGKKPPILVSSRSQAKVADPTLQDRLKTLSGLITRFDLSDVESGLYGLIDKSIPRANYKQYFYLSAGSIVPWEQKVTVGKGFNFYNRIKSFVECMLLNNTAMLRGKLHVFDISKPGRRVSACSLGKLEALESSDPVKSVAEFSFLLIEKDIIPTLEGIRSLIIAPLSYGEQELIPAFVLIGAAQQFTKDDLVVAAKILNAFEEHASANTTFIYSV